MKSKLLIVLSFVLVVAAGTAHAATGGAGLPWETPLTTLANSVTGPVAYAVSLIGIVGAGGLLIFAHGQINEFFRMLLYIVMIIAFVITAKNTLTAFGFAAGAEISQSGGQHGFAPHYTSPSRD